MFFFRCCINSNKYVDQERVDKPKKKRQQDTSPLLCMHIRLIN